MTLNFVDLLLFVVDLLLCVLWVSGVLSVRFKLATLCSE